MNEELNKFIQDFFKSLNATISIHNNLLKIEKIPLDFQSFYGKKEPYILSFEDSSAPEITEVIKPSSFLVGCIRDYLKTKGQTTLINLIFDSSPKEIINRFFLLKNSELSNLNKKEVRDFLLRFSFQTIFQYQNQKESENHQICIYKNQIVNINLDEYKYEEGKNSNLVINTLKKDYDLAKLEIKKIIQPKIDQISIDLDKKLEKEIKRIEEHFSHQTKEIEKKIKNLEEELVRLEKIQNPDTNTIQKIAKTKETHQELKKEFPLEKIKKEQDFFINDEKHKHSLNLSTKLLNTTIISYPLYTFSGYLKNKETARVIELTYNPLLEKMQEIKCDCCKIPIKVMSLCSSGHLVCDKCLRGCSECGKDYCNNCLTKSCFSCGKKLCKKCTKRCSKCLKDKCSAHMAKSNVCVTCDEKSLSKKFSVY